MSVFTVVAAVWTRPEPSVFIVLQRVQEVFANLEKNTSNVFMSLHERFSRPFIIPYRSKLERLFREY
jgi:hypothetical protein